MFKENLKKNNYILLATMITAIIVLITYVFCGFYPFGANSILRVDLYHQYAPFHEELRAKLLSFDSLFYSWEGGLGKEFLSQIAYYTASPISLLILFFPTKYISEAILLFVFIKIVLCAFSFSYYLKNSFKKDTIFITIFGIMYAFMAYITSFYWNIMWLDSIYLFPIVALGIERLVDDGRYKTYLISLACCIIVNFYIAFLVCVFATLYFLVRLFSKYSIREEGKLILDRIVKFAILSLLAGGLTMFLAIPTAIALGRTQTSDSTFPSFEIYQNMYQIITNHFSGAKPVVLARNEDLPNIYSGVLTMVLLPTYFFNKEIKIKERIYFAILIVFMLLCSVFKQLDYIIHGAHFPANLPHRYTFIYSFMILMLAYKSLVYAKGINNKILYIFIPFYIIVMYVTEYVFIKFADISRVLSLGDIIANIILLIIYMLMVIYYKNHREDKMLEEDKTKKIATIFSISFIVVAMALFVGGLAYDINTFKESQSFGISFYILVVLGILLIAFTGAIIKPSIDKINIRGLSFVMALLLFITSSESLYNCVRGFMHSGATDRAKYIDYVEGTDEIIKYIKENDKDDNKFFRQEFYRFSAINESTMYHYNGFSQFSSLAYGDLSKLIENLGIAATSNSYRYYDPTPIIDAMFNMKYIMAKDNEITNPDYELIGKFNNIYLYKNTMPLSLGFMVDENIENWDTTMPTPFMVQEDFVQKAGANKELFTEFPVYDFRTENVDIENKVDSETNDKLPQDFSYTLHDETNLDMIPTVYSRAYNPETQRVFLYVESPNSKRFKYTVDGQTYDREISTGRSLIDLGILNAGTNIDIEFSLNRKGSYDKTYHKTGSFRVYAVNFNEEMFKEVYSDFADEMLTVTEYDSTYLKGTIEAKEDGIMYTSIPYDKGFKAYIDGKEVPTIALGDGALIGLKVSKGTHEIVFKYSVRGFWLGVGLSIISVLGVILYVFYDRKRRK